MLFTKNKKTSHENLSPDAEYFTIHDSKVGSYRDPVLAINRHDLLRQIDLFYRNESNHKDPLFINAEDFSIFKIGEYYKKTGTIYGCEPEHVANCHDLRSIVLRSQNGPVGIAST